MRVQIDEAGQKEVPRAVEDAHVGSVGEPLGRVAPGARRVGDEHAQGGEQDDQDEQPMAKARTVHVHITDRGYP